ncbi:MAG: hypothetical protein ACF8MJ_01560 [Phycisphaerales bacterium JB050]
MPNLPPPIPWTDWQFWLVTTAALAGLWTLVRMFLPKKKPKGTRTTLTISAKGRGE